MAKKNNINEEEQERLRKENELKKNKLKSEQGAFFSDSMGNGNLPPEIESQFLDSIMKFEESYQANVQTTVYKFLGKPKYKKVDKIPDSKIKAELEKLRNVMEQNLIELDTLCPVDDRELYRFITEELFLAEMDDMRIDGMIHHFTYEEFHPNHEYDITEHSNYFIKSFLNKESDFYTSYLTGEGKKNTWFENFRNSFQSFSVEYFNITDIEFDTENATVVFDISFSGIIEGTHETQSYKGQGKMELVNEYDYWCIQTISFPMKS
jgi:hypothetical protein